ncbi:uncharacterized protein, PEP-CTERM system associated [Rugamonas rubra]|uniref:Uncharacterized protein, PEP-CTERM system associated n=2 Tax=Rugamonas rubra TaxID=758825 RepID=A0A1I4II30_9BURK|nr:uncharacterized protein, PEP-CTERM system associated [Rugamonas rubra]
MGRAPARGAPRRRLLAAVLALLFAPASRAELVFSPAVELRASATDNANMAPPERAHGRVVAEVAPGFSLSEQTARLNLKLAYQLRFYTGGGDDANSQRHQSQLQASAKARLLEDWLFLDGAASISQQSTSAFGPQQGDNGYSTLNRNEVRTLSISPYLRRRLGAGADLELRYTRDQVDSNNAAFGRSQSDQLFASLASGPAFRSLGWGLQLSKLRQHDSVAPDSSSSGANGSLSYGVSPSLNLSLGAGYDKMDFGLGGVSQGRSWTTGLRWAPTLRSSLQLSHGRRYYGASNGLSLQHRSRNTVWSAHYDDSVTTSRSQFLLPAAVSTAELLNRLMSATISDPLLRAQAVEAYIRANSLPRSLATSVNYFSNRYSLQKQLQASVGLNTARTITMLSVYDTRRSALSARQSDSALLGSSSETLNDDTRQRGASVALNWHPSSRFGATLSADLSNTRSLSTGLGSRQRSLRLQLNRQFQPRLSGNLELRRVHGDGLSGAGAYTENAVALSISLKL